MLKPIETVYRGFRFRSRLEARWAVCMDAVGVRWDYEPDGYDLDGEWYLPDFWLPKENAFLEVKPRIEEFDLCDFSTDKTYEFCSSSMLYSSALHGMYARARRLMSKLSDHSGSVGLIVVGNLRIDEAINLFKWCRCERPHKCWHHVNHEYKLWDERAKAYAQQARFEYGECG